jgi:hypothetical protein
MVNEKWMGFLAAVHSNLLERDVALAQRWIDHWLLHLLGGEPLAVIQGTVTPSFQVLFPLRFGPPGGPLLPDPVTVQLDTGAFELCIGTQLAQALGIPETPFGTITGVDGRPIPVEAGQVAVDWSPYAQQPDPADLFSPVHCVIDPDIGVGSGPPYPLFGSRFFRDRGLELRINYRTGTVAIYRG